MKGNLTSATQKQKALKKAASPLPGRTQVESTEVLTHEKSRRKEDLTTVSITLVPKAPQQEKQQQPLPQKQQVQTSQPAQQYSQFLSTSSAVTSQPYRSPQRVFHSAVKNPRVDAQTTLERWRSQKWPSGLETYLAVKHVHFRKYKFNIYMLQRSALKLQHWYFTKKARQQRTSQLSEINNSHHRIKCEKTLTMDEKQRENYMKIVKEQTGDFSSQRSNSNQNKYKRDQVIKNPNRLDQSVISEIPSQGQTPATSDISLEILKKVLEERQHRNLIRFQNKFVNKSVEKFNQMGQSFEERSFYKGAPQRRLRNDDAMSSDSQRDYLYKFKPSKEIKETLHEEKALMIFDNYNREREYMSRKSRSYSNQGSPPTHSYHHTQQRESITTMNEQSPVLFQRGVDEMMLGINKHGVQWETPNQQDTMKQISLGKVNNFISPINNPTGKSDLKKQWKDESLNKNQMQSRNQVLQNQESIKSISSNFSHGKQSSNQISLRQSNFSSDNQQIHIHQFEQKQEQRFSFSKDNQKKSKEDLTTVSIENAKNLQPTNGKNFAEQKKPLITTTIVQSSKPQKLPKEENLQEDDKRKSSTSLNRQSIHKLQPKLKEEVKAQKPIQQIQDKLQDTQDKVNFTNDKSPAASKNLRYSKSPNSIQKYINAYPQGDKGQSKDTKVDKGQSKETKVESKPIEKKQADKSIDDKLLIPKKEAPSKIIQSKSPVAYNAQTSFGAMNIKKEQFNDTIKLQSPTTNLTSTKKPQWSSNSKQPYINASVNKPQNLQSYMQFKMNSKQPSRADLLEDNISTNKTSTNRLDVVQTPEPQKSLKNTSLDRSSLIGKLPKEQIDLSSPSPMKFQQFENKQQMLDQKKQIIEESKKLQERKNELKKLEELRQSVQVKEAKTEQLLNDYHNRSQSKSKQYESNEMPRTNIPQPAQQIKMTQDKNAKPEVRQLNRSVDHKQHRVKFNQSVIIETIKDHPDEIKVESIRSQRQSILESYFQDKKQRDLLSARAKLTSVTRQADKQGMTITDFKILKLQHPKKANEKLIQTSTLVKPLSTKQDTKSVQSKNMVHNRTMSSDTLQVHNALGQTLTQNTRQSTSSTQDDQQYLNHLKRKYEHTKPLNELDATLLKVPQNHHHLKNARSQDRSLIIDYTQYQSRVSGKGDVNTSNVSYERGGSSLMMSTESILRKRREKFQMEPRARGEGSNSRDRSFGNRTIK